MSVKAGDTVDLDGLGRCEVLRSDDPSLVTLKRPNGAVLRVGDKALRDMLTTAPAERLRRQEAGHGW